MTTRFDEIKRLADEAAAEDFEQRTTIADLGEAVTSLTEDLDQARRQVTGLEADLADTQAALALCEAGEEPSPSPPPPPPDPTIKPSLVPAWNGPVLLEDGFEGPALDYRKWTMGAEPGNPRWTGSEAGGAVLGGDVNIIPDPTGKRGGNVFRSGIDPTRDPTTYTEGKGHPNKSHLHNWWVTMGKGAIKDGVLVPASGSIQRVWCGSAWLYIPADWIGHHTMLMQIKSAGTHHPLAISMTRKQNGRRLQVATRMPDGPHRVLEVLDAVPPLAEWFNIALRAETDKVAGRIAFALNGEIVFDREGIMTTETDGAYFGVGNYVSVSSKHGEVLTKCHYLVDDVRLTLEA